MTNNISAIAILCLVLFASLCQSATVGKLTFYGAGADSGGTCSLNNPRADLGSSLPTIAIGGYTPDKCGLCVHITPIGTGTGNSDFPTRKPFVAFVNNQCPECPAQNLDFAQTGDGIWDISWYIVDCPTSGNIALQLKTGSTVYWTEISARNYRTQLTKLEFNIGGTWTSLTRKDYNYFQYGQRVYPPVGVRMTSFTGEQLYYTLSSSDYSTIEPGLIQTGVQFSGSGSAIPPSNPPPSNPPPSNPPPSNPPPSNPPPSNPPPSSTGNCCYEHNDIWWIEVNFNNNKPTGAVQVQCSDGRLIDCASNYGKYQCNPNGVACNTPRNTIADFSGQSVTCSLSANCAGYSGAVSDVSAQTDTQLSGPAIAAITAGVVVLVGIVVVIAIFTFQKRKHELV